VQELGKFMFGRELQIQRGWVLGPCQLKIFVVSNVTPLQKVTVKELAEADVIFCSYRLLYSDVYLRRRQELAKGQDTQKQNLSFSNLPNISDETAKFKAGKRKMQGPARVGCEGVKFSHWEDLQFPVLEQFYWRRIVWDEFHELEQMPLQQKHNLVQLRSHYRWGLTGTPPVASNAGVIFMSSLFRIDVQGGFENENAHSEICERDPFQTLACSRFIDHFVRQNTAQLPNIKVEEHVILVRHTNEERALYLGQAHDAPDLDDPASFSSESGMTALSKLVKLCSHFQAAGANYSSAKDECQRIGEQKTARAAKAQNVVKKSSRAIMVFEKILGISCTMAAWVKDVSVKDVDPSVPALVPSDFRDIAKLITKFQDTKAGRTCVEHFVSCLDKLSQEAEETSMKKVLAYTPQGEVAQECLSRLNHQEGLNNADGLKGLFTAWGKKLRNFFGMDPSRSPMEQYLKALYAEQATLLQEFHEASSSQEFFNRTVKAFAGEDNAGIRSCTICFAESLPLTKMAITPCAHTFCLDCLNEVVTRLKKCSLCNQPLSKKSISPLLSELPQAADTASSSTAAASSSSAPAAEAADKFDRYGTKLASLVKKLKELRAEDSSTKVILFVQFDDLKRKVAEALKEFGIPTVQLQGGVRERGNIIRDWQENPDSSAFVLLLSLTQSASGTNLTAANHVMFLHPMLAPTAEMAVSHELQAIGRARRHGQKKPIVHVWRFVTVGTVEQALTEKHQSGLWTRECSDTRGGA